MKTPTYIMSNGSQTLWSWGDYYYTIDDGDNKDAVTMKDTDVETAKSAFELIYGKIEKDE